MPGVETVETRATKVSWATANQAHLGAEFARLKEKLRPGAGAGSPERRRAAAEARAGLHEPSAIERLSEIFRLSDFERELLLLCAGVEMDSELALLCAEAHGHPERSAASFGLALSALVEPHWTALSPYGPLRSYRLIEVDTTHGLTAGALRIDERVLHYLAGINLVDPRMEALLSVCPSPERIAESHRAVADEAALHWERSGPHAAVLHFCGDDPEGQQDVAGEAARQVGLRLFLLRAESLPAPGPELDLVAQLWRREALLLPGALLIQCASTGLSAAAGRLAETLPGPLMLASRDPFHLHRPLLRLSIDKPSPVEQKQIWDEVLGDAENGETSSLLAEQFRLSARTIAQTASAASERGSDLWGACRAHARPLLEGLSHRITCSAGWDDLILPAAQMETLHYIVAHVRHRLVVHERWGFADKGRRGLGVSALFTGESGTGKTLAAEVLAHELALDLYRIDLSSVVSKYIGESEKNLRQIFDAAEEGGVALLFDEADALFGKRTEVKDSHDRYANIEVGYLLQRLEAFQGLVLLTTNFKSSLDRAFQRRLRFTVSFPFPDAAEREEMWRRAFPPQTPTVGLDTGKLAQLHVTGGNIRNIALHAAFLAAQGDRAVSMEHLLEAARMETHKIERPLSNAEIRGWV